MNDNDVLGEALVSLYVLLGYLKRARLIITDEPPGLSEMMQHSEETLSVLIDKASARPLDHNEVRTFLDARMALIPKFRYEPESDLEKHIRTVIYEVRELMKL